MLYATQGSSERRKMSAWEMVKECFIDNKWIKDNWLVNNDNPSKVMYEKSMDSSSSDEFECCGCGGCYQDRGDDK